MSNYEIVIVDYNTGNVDSLLKAVKITNKSAHISNNKKDILNAKKLILPGQGSFDYGMNQLESLEIKKTILDKVLNDHTPILGICLGMQLFGNYGYENDLKTEGLNLIKGEIKKIPSKVKLPHIGWNEVKFVKKDKVFEKIKNNKDFYFVHSYYFDCLNKTDILATTDYNFKFPSIVKKKNIYGFQFHPEKSLTNGLNLLNNFLNI
tara:strand:+ start:69 stop:686 length:618 start_codon:yes stop_codon:yes gene_type:complete